MTALAGNSNRPYNEELYAVYSLPNIIRVIKSRRLSYAGHAARISEKKMDTGDWYGELSEPHHLTSPGVNGRIIQK